MQYYLQAGNTPSLSFAEAKAVICDVVVQLTEHELGFTAESDDQALEFFKQLGASVRLVKEFGATEVKSTEELEEKIAAYFIAKKEPKLKIACAQWGDQQTSRVDFYQIKKTLQENDIKVRFIEGSRHGLSAAVLLHQKISEIVIIQTDKAVILGETIAVQDIDHWTLKDRGKPYADRKKGMLPPKIARAMINMAAGKLQSDSNSILYDPFCGTGTVLIEGLEQGLTVIGSDLDQESMVGAQMNLSWFAEKQNLPTNFKIFQSDVSHVTKDRIGQAVDYIVTEPFLGRPKPNPTHLEGMFRGLEKLYLGAFKQWRSILHDGSKICIVFPRVEIGSRAFDLSGLIDKLSAQGYTLEVNFGEVRYHRKDAVVQRDILVFKYHA